MTKLIDAVHAVEKKYGSTANEDETDPIVIEMHQIANYYGGKERKKARPKGDWRSKIAADMRDKVISLYMQGHSNEFIAKAVNRKVQTVYEAISSRDDKTNFRALKAVEMTLQGATVEEIKAFTGLSEIGQRKALTPMHIEEAARLKCEGLDDAAIAKKMGYNTHNVRYWLGQAREMGRL